MEGKREETPMSTTVPTRPTTERPVARSLVRETWPALVVAAALVTASTYGLLASRPYRGVDTATVTAARAQDVCSLVVAVLLVALAGARSGRRHLLRLALLAYVAYSYAIYLLGLPMNRAFLVYVVLVAVAGGALLDGVLRLEPEAWPRARRRLEAGTGSFLVAVAALFSLLWLSTLLPFALGGDRPHPQGPGGVAYPVFVLDLAVVLPCLAAIGVLLLEGRRVAGPLALVAVVKIVTLFTVLWAGVVAGLVRGDDVSLGADAGPSLVMVAVCVWLARRWWLALPVAGPGRRPHLWPDD
jgi:hypothetical protein